MAVGKVPCCDLHNPADDPELQKTDFDMFDSLMPTAPMTIGPDSYRHCLLPTE